MIAGIIVNVMSASISLSVADSRCWSFAIEQAAHRVERACHSARVLGLQNISLRDVGLRSELFRLGRQSAIAVTSAAFNSSDCLQQPRCGRARVTSSISETPLIAKHLK